MLLALTLLLTAGKAIHAVFHKDAATPGHDCAFVHWANGEVGFAQSAANAPCPHLDCAEYILPTIQVVFFPGFEFPQNSRGPPQV